MRQRAVPPPQEMKHGQTMRNRDLPVHLGMEIIKTAPQCTFWLRKPEPTLPRGYDLQQVNFASPRGNSTLWTPYPPDIGDLIHLPPGLCLVVERLWRHPRTHQMRWPEPNVWPEYGPKLEIFVEEAEDPFVGAGLPSIHTQTDES